jgi:hypothetical protein
VFLRGSFPWLVIRTIQEITRMTAKHATPNEKSSNAKWQMRNEKWKVEGE